VSLRHPVESSPPLFLLSLSFFLSLSHTPCTSLHLVSFMYIWITHSCQCHDSFIWVTHIHVHSREYSGGGGEMCIFHVYECRDSCHCMHICVRISASRHIVYTSVVTHIQNQSRHSYTQRYVNESRHTLCHMGWLQLVGSLKL